MGNFETVGGDLLQENIYSGVDGWIRITHSDSLHISK